VQRNLKAVLLAVFVGLSVTAVFSESPPAPSRAQVDAEPLSADFDLCCLRVCGAHLRKDPDELRRCAPVMRDVPGVSRFHAACCQEYIFELVGDSTSCRAAFEEFWKDPGDVHEMARRIRYLDSALARMTMQAHGDWCAGIVDAALEHLGPEPTPMLVWAIKRKLALSPSYDDKQNVITPAIQKASQAVASLRADAPNQRTLSEGLKQIRYLNIRNQYGALRLEALVSEFRLYVHDYGVNDGFAADALAMVLKAASFMQRRGLPADAAALGKLDRAWLESMHAQIAQNSSPASAKFLADEWKSWQDGNKPVERPGPPAIPSGSIEGN
jgi:hypothetical protein